MVRKSKNNLFVAMVLALVALVQGAWAQEISWTEVGTKEALNSAIADGAHIRLTADITLSAYLKIGESSNQTVTIDLNGHTLSRNLSDNARETNGHVIEVFTKGTLTVTGGSLSGGRAQNGGGISNYGNLTLTNVNITNNKATDGGGIKNNNGATLTINGGSITGSRSDAGGGAVVNYGTATISGSTISGNIATTRGGAIWSRESLTVIGCTFDGNEALAVGGDGRNEGDGGAIHVDGGTATLTNVNIKDNTSKDAGGIYVASSATLNLGGTSTISGNTSSEHGGGGIVNQGVVSLSGTVSITGNTCHTDGGGIWNNGTLNMLGNITIKNNTGDDVYLKSGKVVTVTGAITSGANSIGISMEKSSGTFTGSYATSGTVTNPFFSNSVNPVQVDGGECKIVVDQTAYIERSWNGSQVVSTRRNTSGRIDDISSPKYASGGGLIGADYDYFIATKSVTIPNGLTVTGNVKLVLLDGVTVTVTGNGIEVRDNATFSIYAQSDGAGVGKLVVRGEDGIAAGIGSKTYNDYSSDAGHIVIHGGYVEAHGSESSAGIGGGGFRSGAESLTIYGGTVKAYGGKGAAGIGGGDPTNGAGENKRVGVGKDVYREGVGKDVYIYGGDVTAVGGEKGAGIGGGKHATTGEQLNGHIYIYGGTVNAKGGDYAAGIGGGQNGSGAVVIVYGGHVTADGGMDAAGIGTGEIPTSHPNHNANGGSLTVNGGYVYADGTGWGAGIGGGEDAIGAEVTINGGTVIAFAGSDAGDKNGSAIGSEDGGGRRGSLHIGDNMMVHAGQSPTASNYSLFTAGERVPACFFRPYARIEPCNHQYTYKDVDDHQHTKVCKYCGHTETHGHVEGADGYCECGYKAGVGWWTVALVKPRVDESGDTLRDGSSRAIYDTSKVNVAKGKSLWLPVPTELKGYRFIGWKKKDTGEFVENEFTPTKNDTLRVDYREFHTVTIAEPASSTPNGSYTTYVDTVLHGSGYTLSSTQTPKNHYFNGWYRGSIDDLVEGGYTLKPEITSPTLYRFGETLPSITENATFVATFIRTYGAITIAQDHSSAIIAGTFTYEDETVDIPEGIAVDTVILERQFVPGKFSTIVLPFGIALGRVEGANFYTLTGFEKEGSTWTAVAQAVPADGSLEANKPYLVEGTSDGGFVTFHGSVTLQTVENPSTTFGNWEFRGAYGYVAFGDSSGTILGRAYGFAAQARDGYSVGQFAKAGPGAFIPAMRAYLVYNAGNGSQKNVGGLGAGASGLPETIDVKIVDEQGKVSETVVLNPATGAISKDRWFDIQGRVLKGRPAVKGKYLHNGKVEVVK